MTAQAARADTALPFRHEALVYHGTDEFLDGTVDFVREGLAAAEPVLVALIPPKIALLQAALGADARQVSFVDMAELGRNPARIIPAWREFLDARHDGVRGVRGIGEPIWSGRRPVEIVEAQLHEALLNTAFDDGPGWLLRCPYDADGLPPDVVAAARRSHPHMVEPGGGCDTARIDGLRALDGPLPEPAGPTDETRFDPASLASVHQVIAAKAAAFGLDGARRADLALAVHEIATNSLVHAGGSGRLRTWSEDGALVCEISDGGRIADLLVGRLRPSTEQEGGRGVWLANQLCDLVQIRSSGAGTVVRLYVWR